MRIAFLFLTFGDLNQEYLWREYFKGKEDKFNIYCHPKEITNIKSNWLSKYVIKNIVKTDWGVILNAILELLKVAIQNKENDHFVLLSESCVPIKSFDNFYNFLLKANNKSFVKNMKITEYDKNCRLINVVNKDNYNLIKHYANWCLSRHHVKKILIKENELGNFLKVSVQEEFFLSILDNKEDLVDYEIDNVDWGYTKNFVDMIKNFKSKKNIVNEYKVVIEKIFNEVRKHPRTYYKVDDSIINELKKSESFFARKFDKKSNVSEFKNQLIAS